jgi:hypothetical protein
VPYFASGPTPYQPHKKESPGHSLEPGILGHGRPWENRSAGRTERERSDPLQGSFVSRPGFRWCVISAVAFTTISEMRLSHTRGAAAFGAPQLWGRLTGLSRMMRTSDPRLAQSYQTVTESCRALTERLERQLVSSEDASPITPESD